jgi:hypothetical protein
MHAGEPQCPGAVSIAADDHPARADPLDGSQRLSSWISLRESFSVARSFATISDTPSSQPGWASILFD